jgi:hypothetical protein
MIQGTTMMAHYLCLTIEEKMKMDDNRLQAEDEYEKSLLNGGWNFALNSPMQAATNGFRCGYRAAFKTMEGQKKLANTLLNSIAEISRNYAEAQTSRDFYEWYGNNRLRLNKDLVHSNQ